MRPEFDFVPAPTFLGYALSASRAALRKWVLLSGITTVARNCPAAPPAGNTAGEANWPALAYAAGTGNHPIFQQTQQPQNRKALHPRLAIAPLDPLRHAAQPGNADPVLAIASQLLERFEHGGSIDHLFEVVIWMDCCDDHETFQRSDLITRMQQRSCGQVLLPLHRLCDMAD